MPCRVLARSCRDLISWGCQRLCSGIWQTHCHCGCLFGRLLGRLQQPDLYIIVSSYRRSTGSTTVSIIWLCTCLQLCSSVETFICGSARVYGKEQLHYLEGEARSHMPRSSAFWPPSASRPAPQTSQSSAHRGRAYQTLRSLQTYTGAVNDADGRQCLPMAPVLGAASKPAIDRGPKARGESRSCNVLSKCF